MDFNLEKFIEEKKIFIAIGLFLILGLLIVIAALRLTDGTKKEELGKNQIRIEKGGEIVIVNEDGLVEYRTGDKVFYRQWDADRTSAFFTKMRRKARESKGKESPAGECYTVTLWLDGELISFCVSIDDVELNEELDDVFLEFDNEDSGDDIGSYFDDDEDTGSGGGTPTHTPTLPPGVTATATPRPSNSPTPTPGSGGGGGGNVPLPGEAGCEVWANDIVGGKAIISTTLCVVLSPTLTPSP